jgi:hypothetical protein
MSTPIVAFDESGNSGAHLLDAAQPVFVLASVQFDTDMAADIVGQQLSELKFAKLKRSRSGRRKILNLLNAPELSEKRVLVSAVHKPFMAITKLVDLLVEPLFWEKGIDLYQRGQNLAMANMLYCCMPAFIGRNQFRCLLVAFGKMVRFPSTEHIDLFYQILRAAYDHLSDNTFRDDIGMLLLTRPYAEAHCAGWDGTDLDPAIPQFVQHARSWTERLGVMFSIVHDASKPLMQEQFVLEAMMSNEVPITIGYDRRKAVFPISANGIKFEDSSTFPQIQIADVVASSAAYCLRLASQGSLDLFAGDLLKTPALRNFSGLVWPSPLVTPEELGTNEVGGIDANQYIGRYIANRLGGFPSKGRRKKKA